MSCDSCATHAKNALEAIPGVKNADVSYAKASAWVETNGEVDEVDEAALISALSDVGYTANILTTEDAIISDTANNALNKNELHIAIIGSGSGAFACAIKAAEGGARVTIIESADVIGGCCVNVGCVPSKILIRAAQLAQQQRSNPFDGLENCEPKIDRALLAQQQVSRIEELRQAKYQSILEGNPALSLVKGHASFKDANTLLISKTDDGEMELQADRVLIATGSAQTIPPIEGLADTPFWTSTELLFAQELPRHLIVIGSSVIAVELAQAYRRLGSEVTLLARHTLLYREDKSLGEGLFEAFQKDGIRVLNQTQAIKAAYRNKQFILETAHETITGDRLLIATGRRANTSKLNLDQIGVNTDKTGAIIVNERMETSVKNIYAAGDCSNMPQYVYVAAAAGSRAGVNMTGGHAELDLSIMPAVIFTDPQVATVGLSEEDALRQNIKTESRVLTMDNVPRALANFETDGFIKLIAEKETGRLIGARILAHDAGELIQSAALAIQNKMTVEDLANQLFPYLTMVEGLKLCAQTFNKDVSQLSCCAG